MVLPHRGLDEVVQRDLELGNVQEDILSGLNDLAWRVRRSEEEYTRVRTLLDREEAKAERIRRIITSH